MEMILTKLITRSDDVKVLRKHKPGVALVDIDQKKVVKGEGVEKFNQEKEK